MHLNRRTEEVILFNHLYSYLRNTFGKEQITVVEEIVDHPDIVFQKADGKLVGIEVTRLAYEAFMKWLSKGTSVDKQRKAQVIVNLEKQLQVVLKKKNPKYKKYKYDRKLTGVWLALHNDLYEFSRKGEEDKFNMQWFENECRFYLKKYRCKFDRVLFFEHHTGHIQEIFRKGDVITHYEPAIELPIYNFVESVGVVTKEGINMNIQEVPIEDEKTFK